MIAIVRDPELKDFLIAIGIGAALAISYALAIWAPEGTAVARALNRYHSFWSRVPLGLPARTQLWSVAIVCTLITLAALTALVLRLLAGGI